MIPEMDETPDPPDLPADELSLALEEAAMAEVVDLRKVDKSAERSRLAKLKVLELLSLGHQIRDACAGADIAYNTYRKWRDRDPRFAAQADVARSQAAPERGEWLGDFPTFRKKFFNMDTPWHQQLAAAEYDKVPLGNILMMLWPPEHGKTTLFEDYASMKFALAPNYRFTVGSESRDIARKIGNRVRNRMEPEGPFPHYVDQFGPFVPQRDSSRRMVQIWGADMFNIWKKQAHDERDYSMMLLGFGSTIVSTRTDHLHCDDLQSRKTLAQTETMIATFNQDWLTRPGEYGRTTINGTHVGEEDFYFSLEDNEDLDGILQVIKFPALVTNRLTGELEALWPEKYNLEQLDRMRRKLASSPGAWERNYLQQAGAIRGEQTFTDAVIEPSLNPYRRLNMAPEPGMVLYLSLDPALGSKNCYMAADISAKKMKVIYLREDMGLSSNEEIFAIGDQCLMRLRMPGVAVTDWIIEAMNFQRGLMNDQRLQEIAQRHGVAVREHLTGINKYDESIGIPSMVSDFITGKIELPWADDPLTRFEIGELINQLKKWRPLKRGSKLRMDRVMALWFMWIVWKQRYGDFTRDISRPIRMRGLPYKPTSSAGLLMREGPRVKVAP
jgi:hypothetical protein